MNITTQLNLSLTQDQAEIYANILIDSFPQTLTLEEKFVAIGTFFQQLGEAKQRQLQQELQDKGNEVQYLLNDIDDARDYYANQFFRQNVKHGDLQNKIKNIEIYSEKKKFFDEQHQKSDFRIKAFALAVLSIGTPSDPISLIPTLAICGIGYGIETVNYWLIKRKIASYESDYLSKYPHASRKEAFKYAIETWSKKEEKWQL
jgi:hypothetical protein